MNKARQFPQLITGLLIVLGLAWSTTTAHAAPPAQAERAQNADGVQSVALPVEANGTVRLLVKWQPEAQIAATTTSFPSTIALQPIASIGWQVVVVDAGAVVQTMAELQSVPGVEAVTQDYPLELTYAPNDPSYADGTQWSLDKIGTDIAWEFSSGEAITIAVVDSGIDAGHPDLAGKVLTGYNFFDNNEDTTDLCGHGTHVAGIAAAYANNGTGVAGVAFNAKLLPVKVIDDTCVGSYSRLMQGITFAVDQGARVIVITSGGEFEHKGVHDALIYARENGVIVIAAAGNRASDTPFYPGSFAEVFTVAGTDPDDAQYVNSNFGSQIDVAAPAVRIYSTYYSAEEGSTYAYMSGTSMAAPHVAGVAALILAIDPEMSLVDLENYLRQTSDDLGAPGLDPIFGYGRINAWRAASLLRPPLSGNVKPGHTRIPVLAAADDIAVAAVGEPGAVRLTWNLKNGADNGEDALSMVIYRSEVKVFDAARDIAEVELLPTNADEGSSYSYVDKSVEAGKSYTYWLVETEGEVEMAIAAPVSAVPAAPAEPISQALFIPMVPGGS